MDIGTETKAINDKLAAFCRGCDAYLGEPGFGEDLGHVPIDCLQELSRRIRELEALTRALWGALAAPHGPPDDEGGDA